ncbi:DUF2218 domain-containing protein [Mesorhizobium sp. L-8-3]|uniref:DUF2218 domain-containing protein n=1 Tax=Mesorhizobium sp. L-8-3 TaxID=2744522 RepID=UPI00192772EE|nr:DUF2218 domain-containing protein [Mesorhizobium sp. L-8-3]BCH25514.1 hypothetical protein MesoLjLb_52990 [Mesorhizobium sp. L-8-3]
MSFRSTAVVTTEMASRYLQQLCKHFAHKIPAEFTPEQGTITFPFGVCSLTAQGNRLTMTVTTESEADLPRMQDVVASHLERFAFRDKPAINWNDA